MNTVTLPVHVAIIPDGNRRWAHSHNLPTLEGHRRGFDRANELVRTAHKLGVSIMTLWAFSTENWQRTKEEVSYLMRLYETMIDKNVAEARAEQTRIIHLGRKDRLPSSLKTKIVNAEKETEEFNKHYLCIGIDYGGEDEILRAIKKASLTPGEWTDEKLYSSLDTAALPQQTVDLVIRTSGEWRTSGFMPLQSLYAEYYFSPLLFPDFDSHALQIAFNEYSSRKRRFGK